MSQLFDFTQILFLGLKNNELLQSVQIEELSQALHPFIRVSNKQFVKHPEKSCFKNGAESLHLVQYVVFMQLAQFFIYTSNLQSVKHFEKSEER